MIFLKQINICRYYFKHIILSFVTLKFSNKILLTNKFEVVILKY